MTSEVVRKLEAKGLIHREIDPEDTRARRLRITSRGVEVALRAIADVERADARFFRPVAGTEADTDRITALLRHLAEAPLPELTGGLAQWAGVGVPAMWARGRRSRRMG